MGCWVFEELRGAAVRRDPNEAELFKTEQTGEGEYAGNDALVREVLQNSVDAASGPGPVRVRLAVHEAEDAPDTERLTHYFARLQPPLAARQVDLDAQSLPSRPCRFLVCEDFGTRGLEGDIALFRDPSPEDTSRQDFYWFWRNIGRSGKTGDDLGRWGLGKTVYRAASGVGSMFGLTIRASDRRHLLMGQAVLQIHAHNGAEYMPEGYWCGGQDCTGLPLAIEDQEELQQFRKEWKLTRTEEPGLSVVAPFVHEDLKAERLLEAVAVHFFLRIVRGELVVEIVGNGLGSVTLDQRAIASACKRIKWNGPKRTKRHVAPPIAFVRQCITASPSLVTPVLGTEKLPNLDEESFEKAELRQLRQGFAAGELVGLRALLWLPRKQGGGDEGQLDVWVQQQGADEKKCDTYFVREGMTITKINSRASLRGVQAIVIVDKGPLATLLGDAEGPAHEDWDTSAERPDRIWKTWKGRVKFVRKIVDNVVELLTPPVTEPNFDLLSDFFSIERVSGSQRKREVGDESKAKSDGIGEVTATPKWYQITERTGGFTVSRISSVPLPTDPTLKVAVAYDLPRGDPLRAWSPLDFQIGNGNGSLRPQGKGLEAKRIQGNRLTLRITDEDFRFVVTGFDRHRDLFIRVDDISNTKEAAE